MLIHQDNQRQMSRYGWFSITKHGLNRGNILIESAIRDILEVDGVSLTADQSSLFEVNAFNIVHPNDLAELKSARALILPGATILDAQDHAAMRSISQVQCPIFALGVALCSKSEDFDLSAASEIRLPIGSRDPSTHKALISAGIASMFVGCPTLFVGSAQTWEIRNGPIVAALGRGEQQILELCILACTDIGSVIILRHVPELQPTTLNKNEIPAIDLTDARDAFSLYASASLVITSRIHALLPCIAFGTPVIFLGGWWDSRYSLIEYLGIDVVDPIPELVRSMAHRMLLGEMPNTLCFDRAKLLRGEMRLFIDSIGEKYDLGIKYKPIEREYC